VLAAFARRPANVRSPPGPGWNPARDASTPAPGHMTEPSPSHAKPPTSALPYATFTHDE